MMAALRLPTGSNSGRLSVAWLAIAMGLLHFVSGLTLDALPRDAICCVYDQWEAVLYLDNANIFVDAALSPFSQGSALGSGEPLTAAAYLNGSVQAAYDWTHRRTFLKVRGSQVSNVVPTPLDASTTIINDYAQGVQYQFHGEKCQKSKLDNMTRQCVPDGSDPLGSALVGVNVTTQQLVFMYAYNQGMFRLSVRVNDYCDPMSVVYSPPRPSSQSLVMYNLEVTDLSYGINDTSIFTPPPSCQHADFVSSRPPFVFLQPF